MQYSTQVVEELNALSKEVLGSRSRWRKLINNGIPVLVTEESKYLSLKDGKEVTETITIAKLHQGPNGGELHQYELQRFNVESVKTYLLDLKAKQEEFRKTILKMQEDAKAKEAAKQAVQRNSGSSV